MKPDLKENIKEENTWIRLAFIVLFVVIMQITGMVLTMTVVIQFLTKLLTGRVNGHVSAFGQNLSTFMYQVIRFLTFTRDEMPWPFAPWPDGPPEDDTVLDAVRSDIPDGPVAKAKG